MATINILIHMYHLRQYPERKLFDYFRPKYLPRNWEDVARRAHAPREASPRHRLLGRAADGETLSGQGCLDVGDGECAEVEDTGC